MTDAFSIPLRSPELFPEARHSQTDAIKRPGSNDLMEILLFSVGSLETFGVNVFKVREIGKTQPVTRTPNMPASVEGLISLRGNVIPVLSLARAMQIETTEDGGRDESIMVVEFNHRTLAFTIRTVHRIVRVEWSKIRDPERATGGAHSYISAITELPDGKLVSILDLEEVLVTVFGDSYSERLEKVAPLEKSDKYSVFFVDDSQIARRKIIEVLDRLGVKHKFAQNGAEAWKRLLALANHCENIGQPLSREVSIILLDVEMPELDGYTLTRHIKADHRFDGVPVVMHSSLSSEANRLMAKSAGVDAYVAKFDPEALASSLRALLKRTG